MQQEGRRQAPGVPQMRDEARQFGLRRGAGHFDGGGVAGFAGDAVHPLAADHGTYEPGKRQRLPDLFDEDMAHIARQGRMQKQPLARFRNMAEALAMRRSVRGVSTALSLSRRMSISASPPISTMAAETPAKSAAARR